MCMRIWSGFSKFIRSQCNKDRVIDSLYFGSFYRKDSNQDTKNPYVFVTESARNTFNDIKLNVNEENFQEVPSTIKSERDFVSANLSAIAQVCNCTAE